MWTPGNLSLSEVLSCGQENSQVHHPNGNNNVNPPLHQRYSTARYQSRYNHIVTKIYYYNLSYDELYENVSRYPASGFSLGLRVCIPVKYCIAKSHEEHEDDPALLTRSA